MKTYRFVLEIPAHSEQEARAKMDLLLQWAAFPKDLNIESLAGSLLQYGVWHCLEKYLSSSGKTQNKSIPSTDKRG
jgi:hypothetical protein